MLSWTQLFVPEEKQNTKGYLRFSSLHFQPFKNESELILPLGFLFFYLVICLSLQKGFSLECVIIWTVWNFEAL